MERGRGEWGARGDEREEGDLSDIHYVPSHTFIYLHIPSYTTKYLHILSYTTMYFKISKTRNLKADMKHKNGHNSDPRASPRVRI